VDVAVVEVAEGVLLDEDVTADAVEMVGFGDATWAGETGLQPVVDRPHTPADKNPEEVL